MATHFESSGKKKNVMERIFEAIERAGANTFGNEQTRELQKIDAQKAKTIDDLPRYLEKSMKGKY